jgi:hypothetical protein
MPDALARQSSLESPESATPIITRTVSAALRGETSQNYPLPAWQRAALHLLGAFPQSVGGWAVTRFQSLGGLDPAKLASITLSEILGARLADYDALLGRFPAILLGAGLGGAAAHLACTLGGPFLPMAFVYSLRGGAPDGYAQRYYQRSSALARQLAERIPESLTIQHFDPVHDGWLTRYLNHLRLKLLDLPPEYQEFIHQRLAPGGSLVYLECVASWLRYRVGPRSMFQVGGWGDLSPQDFLSASDSLHQYAASAGMSCWDWRLPDYPLEYGPESEWGCEPGFGEALQAFCDRHGYPLLRIPLPDPHDYSRLAYFARLAQLEATGLAPAGVQIETFSQYDPTAALRACFLPLWLVFNTHTSLNFLKEMRRYFPPSKPVFFSALATFSHTPDMVPFAAWLDALEGLHWRLCGARPSHYPADTRAVVDWAKPLRQWATAFPQPRPAPLPVAALTSILPQEHALESRPL